MNNCIWKNIICFLGATLILCLSSVSNAEDMAQFFARQTLACETARNAVMQMWVPRIQQAVESGDVAAAKIVGCQSTRQATQACEEARGRIVIPGSTHIPSPPAEMKPCPN